MLKTYAFHSALPPEVVKARLMPYGPKLDTLTEHRTSATLRGDTFYLLCTVGLPIRPVFPFCGRIAPEGTGSRITGSFRAPRGIMIVLACFFGFSWLWSLYLFLFKWNPVMDGLQKLSAGLIWFPALTLWTALCFGFFLLVGRKVNRNLQQATLRFIEAHLLRP